MPLMRYLALKVCLVILVLFVGVKLVAPEWLTPRHASLDQGKALIGGAFTLTDQNGKPFTEKQLKGHYSLVYFGFTHCPDICPTTLLVIKNALDELGDIGSNIQPILISVDPDRDTPEIMKQYVSNFSPNLMGLTGTHEQIKQVTDAYKVFYSRVEQPDSAMGYLVDHSGFVFLMGKSGEYITHFPHTVAQQILTDTLKRTINP